MKIRFIPADPKFAEFFFAHRQDEINQRYNPLLPSTIEDLRIRLSKASSDWSQFETADAFFWFLEFESKLIGIASVQNINRMMLTAEIGYGVDSEFRGQGLATIAVRSLAQQAFELTPLRKLIAYVHEGNLPSRKLLENIGFKQEGLLREHFLIKGEPVHEAFYGLLRQDLR